MTLYTRKDYKALEPTPAERVAIRIRNFIEMVNEGKHELYVSAARFEDGSVCVEARNENGKCYRIPADRWAD